MTPPFHNCETNPPKIVSQKKIDVQRQNTVKAMPTIA